MKNGIKMLMVVGVFAIFAFAPVNEKKEVAKTAPEPVEEVCVEEDGLWCKVVTSDGRTISCILCNCSKLAKAAK